MNKLKYFLPFILLYLVSCDPGGVKFSVYNAGEERIDSLLIQAGGAAIHLVMLEIYFKLPHLSEVYKN